PRRIRIAGALWRMVWLIVDIPISDSQVDFPAIHPKQNRPVNNQHTPTEEQRLVSIAENFEAVLAQVRLQRCAEEPGQQLGDAVSGDRSHSDDEQRESPTLESLHVKQRIKPHHP